MINRKKDGAMLKKLIGRKNIDKQTKIAVKPRIPIAPAPKVKTAKLHKPFDKVCHPKNSIRSSKFAASHAARQMRTRQTTKSGKRGSGK